MKKVALVIPYYGKFHNYFPYVLNSMAANPSIDFLLVVDGEFEYQHGDNVKIIQMQLSDIRSRARRIFKLPCSLEAPYKLCDYKVAYGLIFEDYLKEYDFWGYCDVDVIFGDIRKFITDDILDRYDRILNLGHFTLYRNIPCVNRAFMSLRMPAISYVEAFLTSRTAGIDERGAVCCVYHSEHPKQYTNLGLFDDICPGVSAFVCQNYSADEDVVYRYERNERGALYRMNLREGTEKEIMYVHLQKRDMQINTNQEWPYYIRPNEFCENLLSAKKAAAAAIQEKPTGKVPKWHDCFRKLIHKTLFALNGYADRDFKGVSIQQIADGYMVSYYAKKRRGSQ